MNDRHVVIEKPMALKKSDCEQIISLSEQKNRKVFCVMQNRFSPPAAWIKEVIEKNLLGRIYFVQFNCFWNRDARYYQKKTWHGSAELDGGTLFTQFSHFVDTMLWLFGDIRDIRAHFADFSHAGLTDFEDSGAVIFNFVQGGIGNFNYSTSVAEKNFESSMTVIGANGTVRIGGQYMETVEACQIMNYTMPELAPTNPPNDYGSYTGSAANHHYIIQNLVDVLLHGKNIATTAEEGLQVVDVIGRIYALRPKQVLKQ
jgi:predicted dehydrogenase